MIRVLATFDGKDDFGMPLDLTVRHVVLVLCEWLSYHVREYGFAQAWARCRFVRVPEETA